MEIEYIKHRINEQNYREHSNYTSSLKVPCTSNNNTIGWTFCKCNAPFHAGTVLDPFAGSMTTGVVCKQLGRNFIGVEMTEKEIRIKGLKKMDKELKTFFKGDISSMKESKTTNYEKEINICTSVLRALNELEDLQLENKSKDIIIKGLRRCVRDLQAENKQLKDKLDERARALFDYGGKHRDLQAENKQLRELPANIKKIFEEIKRGLYNERR